MGIFTDEYGELVTWRVALAGALAVALAMAIAAVAFWPKPREQAEEPAEASVPVVPPVEQGDAGDQELEDWLEATEGSELLDGIDDATKRAIMDAANGFSDEGDVASIPTAPRTEDGVTMAYLRIRRAGDTLYLELRHEVGSDAPWEVSELREVVVGVNDQDETHVPISDADSLSRIMPNDVAREVSRQFLASGIANAERAFTMAKGTGTDGEVTRFQIHVPDTDDDSETTLDASYDASFGMLELYPVETEVREVR